LSGTSLKTALANPAYVGAVLQKGAAFSAS